MSRNPLRRREFLKRSSSLIGAGTLAAFLPARQLFARKLEMLLPANAETSAFVDLREAYLLAPDVTYFNHGSIGTTPKIVHEARVNYLGLCETNPWYYMWSDIWEEARATTREVTADFLGCDSREVVFNHNTTEAFNLLAQGLPLAPGDEVLFSSLNHPGASAAWLHQAETRGFSVKEFDFPLAEIPGLTAADIVSLYRQNVTDRTRVLVLPHIDNVVGLRHPVKEIAAMAHAEGVEFVAVDGAQAVGMIPVDLAELGVDFYATSPHKWLQAPKGLGVLYIRKEVQSSLRPMWVTWGQNSWKGTVRIFEDYGTRNLAEVITLADAIAFQKRLIEKGAAARRRELWSYFKQAVGAQSNMAWHSPEQWHLGCSLYAVEVKKQDSREVARQMFEQHGYVFRAFHTPDWNTLRLSLNVFNTKAEIDRFVTLLG